MKSESDRIILTHWGRVTHICVSKLTIIGSDNGLSPWPRQAIIWNFNRNSNIFIQENVLENVVCEMASILSRPQCVKWDEGPLMWLACFAPENTHSGGTEWKIPRAPRVKHYLTYQRPSDRHFQVRSRCRIHVDPRIFFYLKKNVSDIIIAHEKSSFRFLNTTKAGFPFLQWWIYWTHR